MNVSASAKAEVKSKVSKKGTLYSAAFGILSTWQLAQVNRWCLLSGVTVGRLN